MADEEHSRDGTPGAPSHVRFGPYELNLRTAELRKNRLRIRLQEQPFLILAALLERPGEVVLREEIRNKLWPDGTVVEFDHGINAAVKRLRDALCDSVERPRYIETFARKGYRFIGQIEVGAPERVDSLVLQPGHTAEVDAGRSPYTRADDVREPPHDAGRQPYGEHLPRSGDRFERVDRDLVSSDPPIREIALAKAERSGNRRFGGLALFGVVALAAGGLALWKTPSPYQRTSRVLRFTRLTNDGRAKTGPMVTDGSRIYFNERLPGPHSLVAQVPVSGGDVFPLALALKQPGVLDLSFQGNELLVGNDEGRGNRDGTELLLANDLGREDDSVWLQPVVGGPPRRVGSTLAIDAAFGADEKSVLYSHNHAVYSVNDDGSSVRKLLTVQGTPFGFRLSPRGRTFRFTRWDPPVNSMTIMEAAVDGTDLHELSQGCCGDWTADGQFFIFQNRAESRIDLWALPNETGRWWPERDTKPVHLTAGPLDFQYPLPSTDSKRIFAIGTSRSAELVRYEVRGGRFVPFLPGFSAESVAFSADGRWVAYVSYPDGALWRSRLNGSERMQLTFPPLRTLLPRWSPDGRQIAFSAYAAGASLNIYLTSSEGGSPQRILPSQEIETDADWSADGESLLYASVPGHDAPIYSFDLRTHRTSALPGSSGFYSPRWSPDGRHIAAIDKTRHTLALFDIKKQKWTELFGSAMSWENWSHDGRYIYFLDDNDSAQGPSNRVVRLRLRDHAVKNIVEVQAVGRRATGTFAAWSGLGPDDSPLFSRDTSSQEIYALEMEWSPNHARSP